MFHRVQESTALTVKDTIQEQSNGGNAEGKIWSAWSFPVPSAVNLEVF